MMKLKKATLADLDTIIDILKDGSNQLAESGVDQWQGDYPSRDQITSDINNGFAIWHSPMTTKRSALLPSLPHLTHRMTP